jgi:hypothetical protein
VLQPSNSRQDSETGAGLNFRWRKLKSKKSQRMRRGSSVYRVLVARHALGNFLSAAIPRRKNCRVGKTLPSHLDEFVLPFLSRQEGVDRGFWALVPC